MAEELYFIKTNPNIAKINLFNKICREEESISRYLQPDAKSNLEIIKDKIKDSVQNLTREEFLQIFSWFSTAYSSDHEEVKTQLFINGIDIFYEIPASDGSEKFQQILASYEKLIKQDMNYIVDAQIFNQFIVYGIFLTEIFKKEKGCENILCDYLKPDNQSLYLMAESQFSLLDFDEKIIPDLQRYFADLYDLTKFYKGSIIKLEYQ